MRIDWDRIAGAAYNTMQEWYRDATPPGRVKVWGRDDDECDQSSWTLAVKAAVAEYNKQGATPMDPLRFVKFFATIKHGDQKYGGLPYTHHLAAVEAVLRRFPEPCADTFNFSYDGDADELQAAWLHDVVEDTGTKLKEIQEMFGERVTELVGAVTNEAGENRKIRAALTYPKIRNVPGAVRLKLADRIANVESGGTLVKMYKREHEDFRRALYTQGQHEAMWAHLDNLFKEQVS